MSNCYCQDGNAPMIAVPAEGTFLVIDGVVREAAVDAWGYAGPRVHLIVTGDDDE